MNNLTMGSLFDGIAGFPLAGNQVGIDTLWSSEIDPCCEAVTKHHFPNVAQLGDITKIDGSKIPPVDIICGGSPCQDLSVAGKRAGLAGARSGLYMEQIRIIREMRKATNGKYPRYMVWENVPGALSSNKGEDFNAVLEEAARCAEDGISIPQPKKWSNAGSIVGNGWSIVWRILDAQYWGVPQRRRRIFLVADFGGECAGEVLFKQEGLRGDSSESRTAREGVAADAEGSAGRSNKYKPDELQCGNGKQSAGCGGLDKQVRCCARVERVDGNGGTRICEPSTTEAHDRGETRELGTNKHEPCVIAVDPYNQSTSHTSQSLTVGSDLDHTGCVLYENIHRNAQEGGVDESCKSSAFSYLMGSKAYDIGYAEEQTPTLRGGLMDTAVCVNEGVFNESGQGYWMPDFGCLRAEGENRPTRPGHCVVQEVKCLNPNDPQTMRVYDADGLYPALTSNSGGGQNRQAICLQANGIDRKEENGCNGKGWAEDVSYTLNTIDRHAVVFTQNQREEVRDLNGVAAALAAESGMHQSNYICETLYPTICGTIAASGAGTSRPAGQCNEADLCIVQKLASGSEALVMATGQANAEIGIGISTTLLAESHEQPIITYHRKIKNRKYIIRRLTPLECERLQGFPDQWCNVTYKNKPMSDSARYRMCGNSVAIPCVVRVLGGIAAQTQDIVST